MRDDHTLTQSSTALASGSLAGAGAADTAIPLQRFEALTRRLRALRLPFEIGARTGGAALAVLLIGTLTVAVFASAGPSGLVPHSGKVFPGWEAGPLSVLFGHPSLSPGALTLDYSLVLVAMTCAYLVALQAARSLSMRTIAIVVVALNLILLMSPPLQLTDVFNYIGYARLGGLHELNPYTHVINNETWDPIYRFTSWGNLSSPYGPLFTAITYPLALLPLSVAYWALKLIAVACSLTFVWLVWKCATLLERDPRYAVLFVAASPLYLLFALGGFHNDFLMLVPSTAAILLLLQHRDRAAGAALAVAVAVKFSAILLLPFLLIGARPPMRRPRVIVGVVLAAIPLAVLSVWQFGFALPNLADQTGVVTGFSVPNLVGLALGLGGSTPGLLRVANLLVVLTVLVMMRRPREWITGAGWSTLALIASVAWLMPWYLVWVLPLAALGTSVRLRRATLAFTVFLVITFMPQTGVFIDAHGLNPMSTSAGQAALALQQKLQK